MPPALPHPMPAFVLPLGERPQIVSCGPTTHGMRGRERYHLRAWSLHLYHAYRPETTVSLDAVAPPATLATPTLLPVALPIANGYASVFPPGCTLTYAFRGRSSHLYVNFLLPRAKARAPRVHVPAMQDLGARWGAMSAAVEEGFAFFAQTRTRAEVRVWDLLWQLAEGQPAGPWQDPNVPPVIRRALELIEQRLSQPLSVRELAEELGISHNQLLRLFNHHVGSSVVVHVRARRVARAQHLLRYSTLSLKEIASQVGLPDPHYFNKTLRRIAGASPRQLRARVR